jgi:hypothetical protein
MCPFCRGTLTPIRSAETQVVKTYQCLECRQITSSENESGKASYFDWLMSRPNGKRFVAC